jgi:hypothetical protein
MQTLFGSVLAFAMLLSLQVTCASAHLTAVSVTDENPSRIAAYNFYELPYVRTAPIEFPAGATDTRLIGLAVKPDGDLYAYGIGGTLYALTGYETYRGRVDATAVSATPATTPLQGSEFGLGFNPVQDAIGIVDDAGQNLLVSPLDGGLLGPGGGALAYAPGDPNAGASPVPFGAGYSNQYAGATSSTMYVVDSATDSLAIQGSPDSSTPGSDGQLHTVGPLGFDATSLGGLSFLPPASGHQVLALMRPASAGSQILYEIDTSPAAGAATATPMGTVGENGESYRGLAVLPSSVLGFSSQIPPGQEGRGVDVAIVRHGDLRRRVNADYRVRAQYQPGYPLWYQLPGRFEGSITFEPGETEKTLHVDIPEDTLIEPDGEVEVALWDNYPNIVLDPNADAVRVPVHDDDGRIVHASVKRPRADLGRILRRHRLVVSYTCATACRPSMTLKIGGTSIASFESSGGLATGSRTAVLTLPRRARKAIVGHEGRKGTEFRLGAVFVNGIAHTARALDFRLRR